MSDTATRRDAARRALLYALLFAAATAYFRIGAFSSLEMTDEGIVVYPSWRVTQGALPYRDFQHIYAPATFAWNATLFATFGEDIAVVRWSLIAIKALIGLLVFALARRVASRAAALLVWVVFVIVWGVPVWVFNNPYANHYGLLLSLTALLLLSAHPRPGLPALVAAGLCVGVAALFKQTLGAFYAIALLFALLERRTAAARGAAWQAAIVNAAAPLAAVAALGLYLSYTRPHLASPSTVLLLVPAVLAALAGAARARHAPAAGGRALTELLCFAGAAALPVAACIAFYFSRGALAALARDTVGELPHHFDWFVALPLPSARTLADGAVIVALLALARAIAGAGRALPWAVALLGAVGLAAFLPPSAWGWVGDFMNVLWWVPIACVYGFAPTALRRDGAASEPSGRRALTAIWLFAAGSLLQLYPAADLPHVGMILPAALPLLAVALDRFLPSAPRSGWRAAAPRLAVAVLTAAVLLPFLHMQRSTAAARPAELHGFARATGIWNPGGHFAPAVDLVSFLTTRPEGIFVVANQPTLYFLAARRSPFDTDDHVLYMVGTGLIAPENARRLVSEARLVERLERDHPLVVDDDASPAGDRFRAAFPAVQTFLAEHYRPLRSFANYRVSGWAASGASD